MQHRQDWLGFLGEGGVVVVVSSILIKFSLNRRGGVGIGYRGGIGSREKGKDEKVEQEVRREGEKEG